MIILILLQRGAITSQRSTHKSVLFRECSFPNMNDKSTSLLVLTWTLLWLGIVWTTAHAQEGSPDDTIATSGSPAGLDPMLKSALTPEFLESKIKEAPWR
jgi:preprotein translocase subunit SecG